MELVVFDLDGTLLNSKQSLSEFTCRTLELLQDAGIAYTIATGRTRLAALPCLAGHTFPNVQIFKNGVEWWDPNATAYRHRCFLSPHHIADSLAHFQQEEITPFVFCLEEDGRHTIYHTPSANTLSDAILNESLTHPDVTLKPLNQLKENAKITNISAIGQPDAVARIVNSTQETAHLTAYSGGGIYNKDAYWLDIHHSDACKGSAIKILKQELGLSRIICFGDGDNDLSMFAMSDESYAMENASPLVKAAANQVIGHHDADGVAHFLRQRFDLGR